MPQLRELSWTLTLFVGLCGLLAARAQAAEVDYLAASRKVGAHAVVWEERHRFDFGKLEAVPESWTMPEGEWRIEGGELVATAGERNRVILIAPWDGDSVRVAFDAICETNDLGEIGDITVLLNAAPDNGFWRSGYALTAASYYNSCATFYRFGKPLAKTEHTPVVPGQQHHVVVEFVNGHIRYWLDDALVLEAWDPEPIVAEANRYIGLRTWNTRLRIDNLIISEGTTTGKDSSNRIYECARRTSRVSVDGRLDDAPWQNATWLTVDHGLSSGALESTEVCLVWDDVALYAAAKLTDAHLTATKTKRDSRVWREECLEFFFDPQARGRLYYEIDVNALGTFYDALNVVDSGMHRTVMESAWNPATTEIATHRTVDGWQLEMRLPFAAMPTAQRVPPLPGDMWRANIYRVNAMADGSTTSAAWNPTKAFHDISGFGQLRFVYPKRMADQERRFTDAAELLAKPGNALAQPFAARLAGATVTGTEGKASLELDHESDVPGIMLARLDRQAIRVSWPIAAPSRIALLAHLYPKAVTFLNRGKADGAVLTATVPGREAPLAMLVNSSQWQLETLDIPEPGDLVLEISPGPAVNDFLDKVFFGVYDISAPR